MFRFQLHLLFQKNEHGTVHLNGGGCYHPVMIQEAIAYSATSISISGRFIFMYLLYKNQSSNPYSLIFSMMNMMSSVLWIIYSRMILDTPLLIRGSSDLVLFSLSSAYILSNRCSIAAVHPVEHRPS